MKYKKKTYKDKFSHTKNVVSGEGAGKDRGPCNTCNKILSLKYCVYFW